MNPARHGARYGCALKKTLAFCLSATLLVSVAQANDDLFDAADQAARDGRIAEMQRIYESILLTDPENVSAITGRAAALAWQQKFTESQTAYREALEIQPDNVEALVGLGYAYAWAGEYSRAHNEFNRALALNPTHIGARKGISLSYLWAGENELALASLRSAATLAPDDAEIWETAGYAHLGQLQSRDAIDSFDHALALDPNRDSARLARLEAYRAAPALEVFAQVGATSGADAGLRRVELTHWLSRSTRLVGRYDNSLGLDTVSIADRDDDAPGYFAGLSHRFRSGFTLIAEAGVRDLNAGHQNVFAAQGVYEAGPAVLRVGGQLGDVDAGYTDELIFAGANLPISSTWRIEPILYLAESGREKDTEWRAVVNVEGRVSSAFSVGAFAGGGQIDALAAEFDGSTSTAGGWLRWELGGPHAITLSARHEATPSRDFNVIELGFTYRLPGNRGGVR